MGLLPPPKRSLPQKRWRLQQLAVNRRSRLKINQLRRLTRPSPWTLPRHQPPRLRLLTMRLPTPLQLPPKPPARTPLLPPPLSLNLPPQKQLPPTPSKREPVDKPPF